MTALRLRTNAAHVSVDTDPDAPGAEHSPRCRDRMGKACRRVELSSSRNVPHIGEVELPSPSRIAHSCRVTSPPVLSDFDMPRTAEVASLNVPVAQKLRGPACSHSRRGYSHFRVKLRGNTSPAGRRASIRRARLSGEKSSSAIEPGAAAWAGAAPDSTVCRS